MPHQFLIGKNSVYEALKAGRPLRVILLSRRRQWDSTIREIIGLAKNLKVAVRQLDEIYFPREVKKLNHQGIVAEGSASEYIDVGEIYDAVKNKSDALVLLAENITDPQNLGAILRSAEAAGVNGVILPKNRCAGVTTAVHRVSAGACEHLKISRVANLNQAIDNLKKAGLWIFGLEATGREIYNKVDLKVPLAFVIGGEDEGISHLTKKKCDFLVKIPLRGKVNSLNTSVAAGIFMFEVLRQRQEGTGSGTGSVPGIRA